MKNPKNMTTDELIELADEIKRGMTERVMIDIKNFEKVDKMKSKKAITKKEAVMIADRIKSGMSVKVMNDLEELKKARFKVLMAEQS